MEVQSIFDNKSCWTLLSFFQDGKEIGEMAIDLSKDEVFIYKICSYQPKCGYGTNMIHYLRSIGVKQIEGDADPDSIGFWNKFEPIWKEDSFVIQFI